MAWHFIEYCDLSTRGASLNVSLRELRNPIFNEIRHAIYVLLYTTKIKKYKYIRKII